MNRNLLILGAGGHGRVVKEVAEAMGLFDKIDFLDDNPNSEVAIGLCQENRKFAETYSYAFPAIGNNELRMKWIRELEGNNFTVPVLIHPTAYVSPSAVVHPGTVVKAKAVANTNVILERGCIIDSGSIVDHDAHISYGCHIGCGAVIKSYSIIKALAKIESGVVVAGSVTTMVVEYPEANGF